MALIAKDKQALSNICAVLVLAIVLLWPAIINGQPFYMADTTTYVRGADAAVYRLTGHSSAWTGEYFKRYGSDPVTRSDAALTSARPMNDRAARPVTSGAQPAVTSMSPNVVLLGRSIYYGLLLYLAQSLGNFWFLAALQALLVATAMALTVLVLGRALGTKMDAVSILVRGFIVAACTSAGYFASYLLPDLFGGLALLAFGHLVFLWEQNWRASRAFWFVLLAAAMLFHISNSLLVGLLGLAVVLVLGLRLPIARKGLGAVAAALVIAIVGQAIFSWGVKRETGYAPIAPPYLAARLIAGGPGYRYLREHCPQIRLIYCRAADFKTPIADTLLWSTDTRQGIFQALTPAGQRLAAAQQSRFVIAVFRERPLDVIGSSIDAFLRQLALFKLTAFNYAPFNIAYFESKIPPPFIEHARGSKAYQGLMPVKFVEWATLVTVLLSVVAILWTIISMISRSRRLNHTGGFLLSMMIGVLLNALVCGAVSTPKGRYQMRLIWVLPIAALASRRLFVWEAEDDPEQGSGPQANSYSLQVE